MDTFDNAQAEPNEFVAWQRRYLDKNSSHTLKGIPSGIHIDSNSTSCPKGDVPPSYLLTTESLLECCREPKESAQHFFFLHK